MVLCVAVRDMLRKRGERRGDLLADLRIGDRSFWPDGVARDRNALTRSVDDVGMDVAQHLAQGVMGICPTGRVPHPRRR